ncbi:hypothetical protein NFI96_015572 [Prochilodus magdalenae]|nr:hypothetical protein NFI96_015572 [Prochilodus magdalenae]
MAMLSNKTAQEISWMLDDYGIKHGPVVDSTRALYEKKLREAMAKERRSKPPSYRGLYREEDEDITYIHHRKPLRQEHFADKWRTNPVLPSEYEELDTVDEPVVYRSQRNLYQHSAPKYETQHGSSSERSSGRFVPLWLQVLLFLIVLGILVFIFIHMEPAETEPFRRLT